MNDTPADLAELRRSIDAIDDELFALLKKRAALVASVGASKAGAKGAIYRPAREAQIMRRLVERAGDPAEAAAMVRIWRALIAASYARQGGMRVIADRTVAPIARSHFATEAIGAESSALGACYKIYLGQSINNPPPPEDSWDVAVTRIPAPGGPRSWFAWVYEMRYLKVPLYVCGRLPFYSLAPAAEPEPEALVYSGEVPGPSGQDTTLIAARADAAPAGAARIWAGRLPDALSLFALEGYVKPDEPTFKKNRIVWLGAYPRPLGPDGPRPDTFAEPS
jgi:chorismate mutase-like protein